MDRSLSSTSMDNVLDNLLYKAAQFPRTDSEDQFRKFLERIPSASNLAGHAGSMQSLPQAQQEQLQQQMAQFQQQSLQLVSSGVPVSTQLPEGGSLNVSGIPRVPSLDLLRQIVNQQQQQYQSSPAPNSKAPTTSATVVKEEVISKPIPTRPSAADALKSSAEPALSLSSGSIGLSLPVALGNLTPAVPVQGPVMAAATMQLGGMPPLQSQPSKKSDALPAANKDSKAEIRRARRMLSNRESARRSRRRKQEHLGMLEEQIQGLEEERDLLAARVEKLERQLGNVSDQNQSLKRENEDLRQRLGIEAKDKKGGNSNKRQCNGH